MNRRDILKLSGTLFAGLLTPRVSYAETLDSYPFLEDTNKKINFPILLNFNENNLGLSSKVKMAINQSLDNAFRYPDEATTELYKQLAIKLEVTPDSLMIGPGSSDIIRAAIHYWAYTALQNRQKIQLIMPTPSFNLAGEYAEKIDIPVVEIPLNDKFQMDIAKMQETAAQFEGLSICYICNPNNPTSVLTSSSEINKWINTADKNQTYFLIDEAYSEYITNLSFVSSIELVKQQKKNVLVTKTFSKVYAMAGLRIGYGIAAAELAQKIKKFISVDNLNLTGIIAAKTSLEDTDFLKTSLSKNELSRKIVELVLNELNLRFLSSQANFIFHEIKGDSQLYINRMKEAGIMVGRSFPPLTQWSRLTLGTPDEMKEFAKILLDFRKKGWI